MRRPTLTVDTSTPTAVARKSTASSVSSMSQDSVSINDQATPTTKSPAKPSAKAVNNGHNPSADASSQYKEPNPSLVLLFSLFPTRDLFVFVLPAVVAALIAAVIPPFMTVVIGDIYHVFAVFQSTEYPTRNDMNLLIRGVTWATVELCIMGGAALLLSGVMSSLWIWVGERNVMYLRRAVYDSVASREMEWFDKNSGGNAPGEAAVGAGGLMSQFASTTEDVRMATALNMGMFIQHSCTIIAATIMAFVRAPVLAAVILSTIPVIFITQTIGQIASFSLYTTERTRVTNVSTIIDRAVNAISTVKAFNAQPLESARANFGLDLVRSASVRLSGLWAGVIGVSQFVNFSMFVQGFWFGAREVKAGRLTAADVLAVFWACLIAASTLQQWIGCTVVYARGKSSMVTLVKLIHPPPSESKSNRPDAHMSLQPIVKTPKRAFFGAPTFLKSVPLKKIRPPTFQGEFNLSNITFCYPTRPDVPVLSNVSLFLPSGEMTFIVGESGSGKSTIAQLLLRLYEPQQGSIELDSNSFSYLDEQWTRSHIAAVSQGHILFDGTVHENVALGIAGGNSGRHPKDVTREEVIAACRVALMHDFVRDLPDGYDTKLGNGGASLSGGQKQRLSIARAYIRNPEVLILDEATSALDGTSRLLVFEAIKHWRRNKTTIVITHDLSQISRDDFVYLLKDGHLVEQGYRQDLEADTEGEFYHMMVAQGTTGGFLPVKDNETEEDNQTFQRNLVVEDFEHEREEMTTMERSQRNAWTQNPTIPQAEPWMHEAVMRLQANGRTTPLPFHRAPSRQEDTPTGLHRPRRRSLTIEVDRSQQDRWRRSSLPTSSTSSRFDNDAEDVIEDDAEFEQEKNTMQMTAVDAQRRRVKSTRRNWETPAPANPAHQGQKRIRRLRSRPLKPAKTLYGGAPPEQELTVTSPPPEDRPHISFFKILGMYWPTLPYKPIYIFGLFLSILSGICAPVFGFFLSRLLVAITTSRNGVHDTSLVTQYGVYVLLLAIANGVFAGLKHFVIEWTTNAWLRNVRKRAFNNVMMQDKAWFDMPTNIPSQLLQLIMRDPEDARSFISLVVPQCITVVSMISTGLIWALVVGWQLTLVGLALAPIYIGLSALQNRYSGRFTRKNKEKREDVNKKYYDTVANVRAIRFMGFDSIFRDQFSRSLESAMRTGTSGAFVDGMGYGIINSLIYLAQGLIYFVGARFMVMGIYSFLQMIEVLNLVAFSLAIAAQMLEFSSRLSKSLQALRDFERLLNLKLSDTTESQGSNRWRVQGPIRFHDVSFAYPTRPNVEVLRHLSLTINPNECVAIVGASGSGKSTVASLLERLYEPTVGYISINGHRLQHADVVWLREHVSMVSQQPYLFDAPVEENIGYGGSQIYSHEKIEQAAREANVHDFIMSLPNGYNTFVGENASLISGGQAQRISIARALVRDASVLILDECTSALDAENQREVMNTIRKAKNGRTTIIITHKLSMMQMADRIIVLDDGRVAEQGTYDQLMKSHGTFHKLATAGEWEGAN